VHHGGLLPILKEAVEVLFAQGLIKVLIATETFAMGVNMPARTVVFNSFRKHDGKRFRDLLPGEYTQMAGRAGRRGIDAVGTVLLAAWGDVPGESVVQKLLTGQSAKLHSKFRLTYGMILNLLRVADLTVEDMIRRSFSEFHTQRTLSGLDLQARRRRVEALLLAERQQAELREVAVGAIVSRFDRPDVVRAELRFRQARSSLAGLLAYLRLHHAPQWVDALAPGRMAWVLGDDLRWKLPPLPAILLTAPMPWPVAKDASLSAARHGLLDGSSNSSSCSSSELVERYVWVLMLLPEGAEEPPAPAPPSGLGTAPPLAAEGWSSRRGKLGTHNWWLECLPLSAVGMLGDVVFSLPAPAPGTGTGRPVVGRQLSAKPPAAPLLLKPGALEAQAAALHAAAVSLQPLLAAPDTPAIKWLDPASEFRITSFDFVSQSSTLVSQWSELLAPIVAVYWHGDLRDCYASARTQSELSLQVAALDRLTSSSSLALFPDFRQRLTLLQRLGYVDPLNDAVLAKGRAACEINTCNEILATETLFQNVLEPLNPPEVAAILSALVCQEKGDEGASLTTRMEVAREQMNGTLHSLLELQDQERISTDEETRPALNFGLSTVVYQWARGVPFAALMEITTVPEGSIVRTISRLDELIRDFRNAARVVGSPSLYRKMEAASECIRRDVVFAASLYVE